MKRGTLLGQRVHTSTPDAPTAPIASIAPPPAVRASTREGKRNITAFIDEAAHRQLGMLAVTEGTKKQELFVEALNLLFEARGLPRIAE